MSFKGWQTTTIGDQITLQRGYDITKAEQIEGNIPVISSSGVKSYHETARENGPGVVLGRKGVVGSVHFVTENYWPHDTTLFVKDFKGNNPRFIYYFFRWMSGRLSTMDVGSANPTLNRNHVHPMIVQWPSLLEQKVIANTLSCLDDKIELNNKINKTFEDMAQAIFKSWFVDFEPFQDGEFEDSELGRIPKGWKVDNLDNIANYLNGLAMQKHRAETDKFIPVVKIKELNQGFTDDNSDKASVNIPKKYIVEDGDVIFSWSGTLLVKIWSGGLGGLNQHLFKVTSGEYDKWFYYLWTLKYIEEFRAIAKDKATTMGHIKRSHLSEAKVLIPIASDMKFMSSIMNPIYTLMLEISVQNRKLKEIRDALLPRLMSGEIQVLIGEVC